MATAAGCARGCRASALTKSRAGSSAALPHRRFRGRDDPRHNHRRTVEMVRHARRDLCLPVVALVHRLVERLALGFALEPAQPHIDGRIGLAAEAAADDHAFGDLERDDLLLHDLDPFVDLARPNLVLAKLIESHLTCLHLASFRVMVATRCWRRKILWARL